MQPEDDQSPFNSPQEMLVRACYVVCLAALAAGIVLTLVGAAGRDLGLLGLGLGALAVAGFLREWLHRSGRFDDLETAFNDFAGGSTSADPAHAAELVTLLRECEAMERKRGTREFDPWAVLALRHDIRELVAKDPALQRLMRT